MAIFACYNGQIGNGSEAVLVSAPTEDDARVQAREALRAAGRPNEVVDVKLLELPVIRQLA
jgi:hypothetical protein